jgi:hypothetical protein
VRGKSQRGPDLQVHFLESECPTGSLSYLCLEQGVVFIEIGKMKVAQQQYYECQRKQQYSEYQASHLHGVPLNPGQVKHPVNDGNQCGLRVDRRSAGYSGV